MTQKCACANIWSDSIFTYTKKGLCFVNVQVVFLPGFGCLYIHVSYESGTLVLSLAPEGSAEAVINQHNRYCCQAICFVLLQKKKRKVLMFHISAHMPFYILK